MRHDLFHRATSKVAMFAAGRGANIKSTQSLLSFDKKSAAQIILSSSYYDSPPFYKPFYHHLDPFLLKPRNVGTFSYLLHHIQASISGLFSLCTSQQSRDEFLQLTRRNYNIDHNNTKDESDAADGDDDGEEIDSSSIINTNVLNKSDMGFMKVMALFNDLRSPLFDETMFDKEKEMPQFLNGCGFALEQFHITQADYIKNLELYYQNKKDKSEEIEEVEEEKFQYKFFDIAKNDPTSTESTLISMLSPEGLDKMFFETAMFAFVKDMEVENTEAHLVSTLKVMHTCLLSARLEKIEESGKHVNEDGHNAEGKNDPDAPLEDESLEPFSENSDDSFPQTVLQLEVLYDLELIFKKTNEDSNEDNNKSSSNNNTNNNKSFKSLNVAKFETCFNGNLNGDERQWRLCSWRPAAEYGFW